MNGDLGNIFYVCMYGCSITLNIVEYFCLSLVTKERIHRVHQFEFTLYWCELAPVRV